jgi:hypothetical protein
MSSHPLVRGLIDLLKIPRRHTPLMQVRLSRWHCPRWLLVRRPLHQPGADMTGSQRSATAYAGTG